MKQYWVGKLLLLILLTIGFNRCKSMLSKKQMEEKLKQLEKFTYAFGDASVPPPFHRSYTIVADKDSVVLTVDSYGDTLIQRNYPMPENGFKLIGEALLKNKISLRSKKKEGDGCTGGITKAIAYSCKNDKAPFHASTYICGGIHYGNLLGDLDTFLLDIRPLTPDLVDVIRSTQ